jgi:hypothetical protein
MRHRNFQLCFRIIQQQENRILCLFFFSFHMLNALHSQIMWTGTWQSRVDMNTILTQYKTCHHVFRRLGKQLYHTLEIVTFVPMRIVYVVD